jgi:cephalosporin hydroxylase
MDLWRDFLTNRGREIHKWEHYFPVYERHFAPWRGRTVTFLEIGVAKGGSLQMWRRYLGPLAQVVGIDIDPKCKALEDDGVAVRIGDQSDPAFLAEVIAEFGAPDVVLDDGSHQMRHIQASFEFLYPKLPKNGVYMVEDLQCSYWPKFGGSVEGPATFINIAKSLVDKLNAEHTLGAVEPDAFTRETFSIGFYEGIVVFEKGQIRHRKARAIGTKPRGVLGVFK